MSTTTPKYPAIPVLHTRGSYYDVGYNVGFTFADRIRRFWDESTDTNEIDKTFSKTTEGKQYFDNTLKVCKENFPEFIRELEGMAAGSGMEFNDLFLLNLSKEVHNVLSGMKWTPRSESMSCTDVFVNTPDYKMLAHNEDCDPMVMPYGYILKACIVENGEEMENFTAYCYPGVLPGTTVSFNSHGMVFTIDGLYADHIVRNAPSRMFLIRSIIRARSLSEAQSLIRNSPYGVAYGFTVNIVDINSPKSLWSIEIGPGEKESEMHVHEIPEVSRSDQDCHYIHTNSYKHLHVSEIPNLLSSVARVQAAERLPPPRCRQDALTILGDQSDDLRPIFRTDRPTDPSATVFTAVVEPLRNRVEFYQGNPALPENSPFMYFNVLDR